MLRMCATKSTFTQTSGPTTVVWKFLWVMRGHGGALVHLGPLLFVAFSTPNNQTKQLQQGFGSLSSASTLKNLYRKGGFPEISSLLLLMHKGAMQKQTERSAKRVFTDVWPSEKDLIVFPRRS